MRGLDLLCAVLATVLPRQERRAAQGRLAAPDSIRAIFNYVVDDGSKVIVVTAEPGGRHSRSGRKDDPREVVVHNGRGNAEDFTLDREGFCFVRHETKVRDLYDEHEIRQVYYPEMVALIKAASGAERVLVFDHTLRTSDARLRRDRKIRDVVPRVHNDYTEWSGPQRVRDLLPDEAEDLLKRRFAIIQVWRTMRDPVETFPLAVCDARTLSPRNLVVSERRYPDRVGQTYTVTYDPALKWFWFPRMRREEALVFKVFDSVKDGRARWIAHTAFDDPTAPPQARPRESIEIRALAFF